MSITDIYSKRIQRSSGGPDVYQYGNIPTPLRVQVVHIWCGAIGNPDQYSAYEGAYHDIHDALCREYGMFTLGNLNSKYRNLRAYFLTATNTDHVLDIIELVFKKIHLKNSDPAARAIEELNFRFREHAVGYQFSGGEIMRVDSQALHATVVVPALAFLTQPHFQGANAEFLSAHEHYRHAKFKECLNDCLKAFESTMKAICTKRGWTYNQTDTAKTLIEVLFRNALIPSFMQSHYSALRTTLEAGVPTLRNKLGGHGQGVTEVAVPEHLASYALHLTASNILMIAQAESAML